MPKKLNLTQYTDGFYNGTDYGLRKAIKLIRNRICFDNKATKKCEHAQCYDLAKLILELSAEKVANQERTEK
jgi:hypothetical protein